MGTAAVRGIRTFRNVFEGYGEKFLSPYGKYRSMRAHGNLNKTHERLLRLVDHPRAPTRHSSHFSCLPQAGSHGKENSINHPRAYQGTGSMPASFPSRSVRVQTTPGEIELSMVFPS